jgi:hypothetical protein
LLLEGRKQHFTSLKVSPIYQIFPEEEAPFSVHVDGCCRSVVHPERVEIYTQKAGKTNPEALNVSLLSYYSRKQH